MWISGLAALSAVTHFLVCMAWPWPGPSSSMLASAYPAALLPILDPPGFCGVGEGRSVTFCLRPRLFFSPTMMTAPSASEPSKTIVLSVLPA